MVFIVMYNGPGKKQANYIKMNEHRSHAGNNRYENEILHTYLHGVNTLTQRGKDSRGESRNRLYAWKRFFYIRMACKLSVYLTAKVTLT